jgi:hypothetical protein
MHPLLALPLKKVPLIFSTERPETRERVERRAAKPRKMTFRRCYVTGV